MEAAARWVFEFEKCQPGRGRGRSPCAAMVAEMDVWAAARQVRAEGREGREGP